MDRTGRDRVLVATAIAVWGWTVPAVRALENSAGQDGIDARRLQSPPYQLTGKDIFIGQVELSRPSAFGVDKSVNRLLQLDRMAVRPFAVFFRDSKAIPNRNTDDHSQQVAAVMIGKDKIELGIAPGANLISSAYAQRRQDGQKEACTAAQHVVRRPNHAVRAANFSFGEPLEEDPRPKPTLDGKALLSLCLDWLSLQHNTLAVVAGNQGKGGIPIPTDLYNGFVVGFTRQLDGVFRQVDRGNLIDEPFIDRNGNGRYDEGEYFKDTNKDKSWTAGVESPDNGRRSLALLAPGIGIHVPNLKGKVMSVSGSSFAAPHVTATVALLQEYAERQILSGKWTIDARRHEVMKAILIDSADKIRDSGDGKALGMGKTILDANGKTWLESEAYTNRDIPLSRHMGAGQLNASRALQLFQSGQQSPGSVGAIAWDTYIVEAGKSQEYVFNNSLQSDSFIAVTLVWDRLVTLNDTNGNRRYDVGESFKDEGVNDLDLFLMREQDKDSLQGIWSSASKVDNVEHIFVKIPATGRYKLRVTFNNPAANQAYQRYAIAWWAMPAR